MTQQQSPDETPRETEPRHHGPSSGAPVSLRHVSDLLRGLNREQRRAVTHGTGPQLVLAGPGTGKTEVVTRRVAWLIATKKARPREILALTFTDKAAAEMQARVDVLVPYGQADAAIHTFHAFGDRLLREHAFELGLGGDLRLLSRRELIVLLREHVFELGLQRYAPLGDPTRFLGALVDFFQRAKDEDISPADLAAHATQLTARAAALAADEQVAAMDHAAAQAELAVAYNCYAVLLVQRGFIDHADQVALALRLLRERPAIRQAVRERYRYLLVDEFQDTNATQLQLVMSLTGPTRDVTLVGDDDQAIYGFRGAAVSNARRFAAAHPDLQRVVLRRNYRSRAPIIAAGQRLIRHNDGARLAALDGMHSEPVAQRRARRSVPVRQVLFGTAEEEADGIAEAISCRVAAGERPRDFAILVRTNGELGSFVRSLAVRGVPARSSSPEDLFAQPEVRPLLAFLRVVADPSSGPEMYALATAAPYEVGGTDMTTMLREARRRHRALWDVLAETVDGSTRLPLGADTRRRIGGLVEDVRTAVAMSHERPVTEVLYDHLRRSGVLARLARADAASDEAMSLRSVARFFEVVQAQSRLLTEDRIPFLVPHLLTLVEAGEEPTDAGPDADDVVNVLTVHRAKGLEFKVVYVCGLADGRFPVHARPPTLVIPQELRSTDVLAYDSLAEERRLCYVAMTRAQDELWLSRSTLLGRGRGKRRPSPFLAEALDASITDATEVSAAAERIRLSAKPAATPPPAAKADHDLPLSLSFSQVDDYLGCPERYRLRHVVGVPTPPHHALAYGSALHQAIAAFHLAQARGEIMSEDELLAAFARHWLPEGFLSLAHEEARYAAGQAALRRFQAAQLANKVPPPVAIERPFSFNLGRDLIRGRMDRIDDTPEGFVVTDYKSADVRDQAKADEKARDSLQLQIYAMAQTAASGRPVAAVQLHFLDSGVVGRAAPSDGRLERAKEKLAGVADGIRRGDYPARPNPVGCGFCPYRDICKSSAA
ncbi:hypothetical protein BH23CHL6_BH23CHL6_01570 [soil metagenome]